MQQGWICLHRGLLDWEWYNDINTTRLFIHCLLRANHKENKWRGMNIERGQFWTSLPTLEKETGLSTSQIRTCINKLKSTGELTVKPQATGRMVTVIKYNDYQANDRPIDRPMTGQSQTSDRPVTANNNDNPENHDNPENKKKVDKVEWMDQYMITFWKAYPKKKDKKLALERLKRMIKAKPDPEFFGMILDRINQKALVTEKQFWASPDRYLKDELWEDEIIQEQPRSQTNSKADFSFNKPSRQIEKIINQPPQQLITLDGDITL